MLTSTHKSSPLKTAVFSLYQQKSCSKVAEIEYFLLSLHSQSPGGGMVDALVSGASVERRAGSSPVLGTKKQPLNR